MLVNRFAWACVFGEPSFFLHRTWTRRNKGFLFTLHYRLMIDVCEHVASVAKITHTQRQNQRLAQNPRIQQQIIQKRSSRLLQSLSLSCVGSVVPSYIAQGYNRTIWATFHGRNLLRPCLIPHSMDHSKTFRILLDFARNGTYAYSRLFRTA